MKRTEGGEEGWHGPGAYGAAERGYTLPARILHWLTAALVLPQIPLGLLIANFQAGDFLYDLHKSLGVVILPVVVVRLIYRLAHPAPPLPQDIPFAQRCAAQTVHWTLYVLLLIQPIVGWIATSAFPAPVLVFGLFELPPIWPADRPLSDRLFAVHRGIGIALGVLVCGHIAAALHHHFMRRDRVLMRMVGG